METKYQEAYVHTVDGQLVLEDPIALAMIVAANKLNCRQTMQQHMERVSYFTKRIIERNQTPQEVVIVLINADDPHGSYIAEALMPGHDWQQFRDRGEVPYARGLATREGMYEVLATFDSEVAAKLQELLNETVVIVVDYGTAEVFPVER